MKYRTLAAIASLLLAVALWSAPDNTSEALEAGQTTEITSELSEALADW